MNHSTAGLSSPRTRPRPARATQASRHAAAFRDASGRAVFAAGDIGAAHAAAHGACDSGRVAEGYRALTAWLSARSGSGSAWVHLHFHAASFELALGDWEAAYARFAAEILPAAAHGEDALTDAPALLWRLQLHAPRAVELPWATLRHTALECLQRPLEPFVELHSLLALAGARDLDNLDRWVSSQPRCDEDVPDCIVLRTAVALRDLAAHAYRQAADALEDLLPRLRTLGGSLAQNQLFEDLARSSRRQVEQGAGPA